MTLKDCITKIEISSKSPFTERILKWAKQVTPTIVFKGEKKVYYLLGLTIVYEVYKLKMLMI